MAQWLRQRPKESCNLDELKVAESLARLSDDWVVRWGYFYKDNHNVNREGDFLVLGPHGGLMVIEVKGGTLDPYWGTGRWGTADGDNPMIQLDQEWRAVVDVINDHRGGHPSLYVTKAIALPGTLVATQFDSYHGIPREFILGKEELSHFTTFWADKFSAPNVILDGRSRKIFFETYGKGIEPKEVRHFISEADRTLMRHTECNFELLDQLKGNRQLLVHGGVGSGKTWMAFELARRWAENTDTGQRILFMTYNLALTEMLKEMVSASSQRKRPKRGAIVVMSWEELARYIFNKAGLPFEPPSSRDEAMEFFSETVPEMMVQAVREGVIESEFDALVVDEGQDHDTRLQNPPTGFTGPGWWEIYWQLLKEKNQSPLAVFYDPHQRPDFRADGSFSIEDLKLNLNNRAVVVSLTRTVRYSAPIYQYLKTLNSPATANLCGGLCTKNRLPEGPEVEVQSVNRDKVSKSVLEIVHRWTSRGLCRPDQILIISKYGDRSKSAMASVESIDSNDLVDYLERKPGAISFTSAQKAKGLDSLAVILIDFESFETIEHPGFQVSFFLGASRARQLLAVVNTLPVDMIRVTIQKNTNRRKAMKTRYIE